VFLLMEVSLEGPSSSLRLSNPDWSSCTLATALSTASVTSSTLNMHFWTMSCENHNGQTESPLKLHSYLSADFVERFLERVAGGAVAVVLHPQPQHHHPLLRDALGVLGLDQADLGLLHAQLVGQRHPVASEQVADVR